MTNDYREYALYVEVYFHKPTSRVAEKNMQYGSKMRDFQFSWYRKFPWIQYNIKTKNVTCFPCKKYGNNENFSFNNWKKKLKD